MYKLKRMIVWLRRMHHSRGFGVQSPTDYAFIRYVVNEHWPYYAYEELLHSVKGVDKKTRKLCRLYFRMANWRQPEVIVDYEPETDAYRQYMQAGCRKARVVNGVRTTEDGGWTLALGRMSLRGDYEAFWEEVVQHVNERSVLIVEGIKRNKTTEAFWKKLQEDERTGVTFDLYYCGVLFFNKLRFKQNYIVNF